MTILFIMHEPELNGGSKSMLNIIDALSNKHEFIVLSPVTEGPVLEELRKRNIKVIYQNIKRWVRRYPDNKFKWFMLRSKWYLFNQYYNKHAANEIIKKLQNYKIDIIHTNVSVLNIGPVLSKKMNIPHIWHIREFGKEDFNFLPLCSEKKYYRQFDRGADVIVTVSKALYNKYNAHIHHAKLLTIYNGVGDENYIQNKKYEEKNIYKFLISGAIVEGKGQKVAVKASYELIKRGIYNFQLYIAGKGNIDSIRHMPEFDETHITILGQVNDMVSLRKNTDVELVCSASEAFGRVTVEAMMAGNPVIGSNSGGTPELIEPNVTGMLFEKGNHLDLADNMQYLIQHPKKIEQMGKRAQEIAINKYSIRECAKNIDALYTSLAQGGNI